MKNLNIKDIARIAGVGASTVSRVINGHSDVSDETRRHIQEVIDANGYIPNTSARNLKRTDSKDVGILIRGVDNPLFSRMVEHSERVLSEHGYGTLIHYTEGNGRDWHAACAFVTEKRLCGLICLGGDFNDLTDDDIIRLNAPLVLASTELPQGADASLYGSVRIDNVKAAMEAVSCLYAHGHRHIGLISSGSGDYSVGVGRTQGYIQGLLKCGIPKREHYFEVGAYTFETGYEAMQRLLKKAPHLTAVFAISDIMAIGAAKAILDSGRRIPEDISIMGFDDIDYAAYFNPALSTVCQPVQNIAVTAAELLIEALSDCGEREDDSGVRPEHMVDVQTPSVQMAPVQSTEGISAARHRIYDTQIVLRASIAHRRDAGGEEHTDEK